MSANANGTLGSDCSKHIITLRKSECKTQGNETDGTRDLGRAKAAGRNCEERREGRKEAWERGGEEKRGRERETEIVGGLWVKQVTVKSTEETEKQGPRNGRVTS